MPDLVTDASDLSRSIEAEGSLVGGVMIGGLDAYDRAGDVREAHFSYPPNRLVWRAVQALADARIVPDNVTVLERLRADGLADRAGGGARLVDLVESTPGYANVAAYATIVRERAVNRRRAEAARVLSLIHI